MSGLILQEKNKTHHIPRRYVPRNLTKKDKSLAMGYIKKSRSMYKKEVYYTRPKVKSFTSKKSGHVARAKQLYNVENMQVNKELAQKTGCSMDALNKIVEKGKGAYYSSGSRPNQTPQSWGYARLASAISGGNSSVVDYHILADGCKPGSMALRLARKTMKTRK